MEGRGEGRKEARKEIRNRKEKKRRKEKNKGQKPSIYMDSHLEMRNFAGSQNVILRIHSFLFLGGKIFLRLQVIFVISHTFIVEE
jgi:hypothetical protein